MMRRAVGALAVALLCSATAASAAPAEPEPAPVAGPEEVEIDLHSPGSQFGHYLTLRLLPVQGIAVVSTYRMGARESARVGYAIAIPPAPFEGDLNLNFPGLGEFVGTVMPTDPGRGYPSRGRCGQNSAVDATFNGHIEFRGAGDYAHWSASRAEAVISACGRQTRVTEEGNGTAALFDTLTEQGPSFTGDQVRCLAWRKIRGRVLEFIAVGGPLTNRATFIGVDREWLPEEVAVERWVERTAGPFKSTTRLESRDRHPARVIFKPPAPFFGKGTYRRRTGKLTGSLGVRFPGLTLRLAPLPLPAVLEDEEIIRHRHAGQPGA